MTQFYVCLEYQTWLAENNDGKGWTIKYYKGLGTSSTEDAKKYFSNLGFHLKEFKACNLEERSLVDMAFNKKKADDRKEWLRQFVV
jgi:DNA topoisomerase-2